MQFIFHDFTGEWIRHYVLDNLLSWFGVHLVIEQWFKQTLYVRYFDNMN